MKYKSAAIGFSYLAGLICASFLCTEISFLLGGISAVAGIGLFLLKKRSVGVSLFVAALGVFVYAVYTLVVYNPVAKAAGQTVEINGTVVDFNSYGNDAASYEIKTQINGVDTVITLYGTDANAQYGDKINFTAYLSEPKDNVAFAEKSYYKTKGIFLRATAKSSVTVTKGEASLLGAINSFSRYIGERISLYLPGEEGDLIKAFFLGDKTGLSDELKNNIKRSGVSHFAAVSGQHLSIIAHIIMLLLCLTPLRGCRKTKYFILAGIIVCFMLFFRMSASVIRSGVMLLIYYGAEPLMRKSSALNSMGVAALLIVLFNPYACLDPGFLLSLAGTFGIGVLSPEVCRHLPEKLKNPLVTAVIGSFSAVLATFPLTVLFFGGVSAVGVFASLLLQLLLVPVLVCMVLFTLLGGMGSGLMLAAGLCAKAAAYVINWLGGLKYSYIALNYSFLPVFFVCSIAFIIAVRLLFKSPSRTAMAAGISFCVMLSAITIWQYNNRDSTFITFYSDGNDACVFLRSSTASVVVASDDSPKIAQKINQYKQDNFIDSFSVICLLESGNNNKEAVSSIPSRFTAMPDDFDYEYKCGDSVTVYKYQDNTVIEVFGKTLAVSKISNPVSGDISVLYGYKKALPELEAAYTLYSSKRIQPDDNDRIINFFYNSADYIIDSSGNIYSENT